MSSISDTRLLCVLQNAQSRTQRSLQPCTSAPEHLPSPPSHSVPPDLTLVDAPYLRRTCPVNPSPENLPASEADFPRKSKIPDPRKNPLPHP